MIETYLKCTYFHEPVTDTIWQQVIGISMGGNESPALTNVILLYYDLINSQISHIGL
jgi:hypothetical protein